MVNKMKFRKPVEPGDKLLLHAKVLSMREDSGIAAVDAKIDSTLCVEGELTFSFLDADDYELEKTREELYKSCMKHTRIIG